MSTIALTPDQTSKAVACMKALNWNNSTVYAGENAYFSPQLRGAALKAFEYLRQLARDTELVIGKFIVSAFKGKKGSWIVNRNINVVNLDDVSPESLAELTEGFEEAQSARQNFLNSRNSEEA